MDELGVEQGKLGRLCDTADQTSRCAVLAGSLMALSLVVGGCSMLPGGEAAQTGTADAAEEGETAATEAVPEFTPVSALAPGADEVGRVTVVYPEGNAELPENVTAELDRLAAQVADRPDVRLELLAYAKGSEAEASRAKLFSLKRGMLVRSHLHKKGVAPGQVVLRPLGIESADGPQDRVDIVMLQSLDPEVQTRIATAIPGTTPGTTGTDARPSRSSDAVTSPAFQPVQTERPTTADAAPDPVEQAQADEEAAQRARLAQLQGTAPPAQIDAAAQDVPPATSQVSEVAQAEAPSEVSPQGEVIPQGDASGASLGEDSLVSRFEAIAAADVQLAEDPGQRATIARRGGVVNDEVEGGEAREQSGGFMSFVSRLLGGGESEPVAEVPDETAAPAVAALAEVPAPSRTEGDTADPIAEGTASVPQFSTAPAESTPATPSVRVLTGDELEAALAEAARAETEPAVPIETEPAVAVPAVAEPSVAALPPAGTMTTDPNAPVGDGGAELYLVQFEPDSPDMTLDGRSALRAAIDEVLARPDTWVKVVAHAEGAGDDAFLLALSTIRRNEVEGALRNAGVGWGRIWAKAVGDQKPGRASGGNNVVEIIIRQR